MSNFFKKAGAVTGIILGGGIIAAGVLGGIAMPFAAAYYGAVAAYGYIGTTMAAGKAAAIFGGIVAGAVGLSAGGTIGGVLARVSVLAGIAVGGFSAISGGALSKLSSLVSNQATKVKQERNAKMSVKAAKELQAVFETSTKQKPANKNTMGKPKIIPKHRNLG